VRWTLAAAAAVATMGAASCLSFGSQCRGVSRTADVAAPDSFVVSFMTSRGRFDVLARKSWSPLGVARFYELVNAHYFDGAHFFRVIKNFVAQFGLSGNVARDATWQGRCIADEPVRHPNTRGTLSFARGDSNTRAAQLFINLKDNPKLDSLSGFGFPPIGEVVAGLDVVDSLYEGYGDSAPKSGARPGREGPSQDSIRREGNAYLAHGWPELDSIVTARVTQAWPAAGGGGR
jgi:cyclophilin family peptidyl-prolyl cis-trans isomerase